MRWHWNVKTKLFWTPFQQKTTENYLVPDQQFRQFYFFRIITLSIYWERYRTSWITWRGQVIWTEWFLWTYFVWTNLLKVTGRHSMSEIIVNMIMRAWRFKVRVNLSGIQTWRDWFQTVCFTILRKWSRLKELWIRCGPKFLPKIL